MDTGLVSFPLGWQPLKNRNWFFQFFCFLVFFHYWTLYCMTVTGFGSITCLGSVTEERIWFSKSLQNLASTEWKSISDTLASLSVLDTSSLLSLPSTSHSPLSTSAITADPAPAFPVAREPLFSNTQHPHAPKVAKLYFQNFSAVWHEQ